MTDLRGEIRRRLAGAGLAPEREIEIVEEIAQHLEDRRAELAAQGKSEIDAILLAELEPLAERLRRVERRVPRNPAVLGEGRRSFAADLWSDLRYAARALRKNPGFTVVTLLSLALGIGANTAIFQLLDTLHLRMLPVENPQELAIVKRNEKWTSGWAAGWHPDFTNQLWERIRDEQQAFSGVFAWGDRDFNLAPSGEARWAHALMVSGDYFRVLGVRPFLGRTLTPDDDRRGCAGAAVLSHGFWQRELGGDPAALGRKISVEGHAVEIVGIAPAGFYGLEVGRSFDLILPLCSEALLRGEMSMLDVPHGWWLSVVGRLNPGWSMERAAAQLDSLSKGIFEQTVPPTFTPDRSERYRKFRLKAEPAGSGISKMRQDYSTPLYFLLGIAGLVLLIACANLANLLLARASAREREIAVRLAVGASRGRLIRQLMAESLLIALVGAALGLLVAVLVGDLLVKFLSTRGEELFLDLRIDWRVLIFTVAVAALTCLLFGLTPALRAARTDIGLVLKGSGRAATAGRDRMALRRILVAVQVALSFALLFGALLFVRSLRNLTSLDLGFRGDGVIIFSVDSTPLALPKERRAAYMGELLQRIRAVPGVEGAASVDIVPISGSGWNDETWLDGSPSNRLTANFNRVSDGYFATLGTAFVAGRDFDARDNRESPKVAIINETYARKLVGEGNPIGRRFVVRVAAGKPEESYEIIGVVRDAKYRTLREDFPPTAYVSQSQGDDPRPGLDFLVRTRLPIAGVVASLKRAVLDHSPALMLDITRMDRQIDESILRERLMATLAGFFGLLAALLVTIGLYGVISYSVARRTHEIGIRLALGADATRVARMVLGEALAVLAAGLVVGLVLALLGGRAAAALLYGLAPHDPLTIALTVVLLLGVAVCASLFPARRAARVDPMTALREE